ncbi:hypothetical protein, variant, partial [Puccinia triticina 1-1 BBBD Race 1]
EGDIHCPLTSDCMENQKEILSLMRKFENCHGLVLLEKLQDLAILQTSLKPEDAYNFKVAVQALFLTALSNKSQQKEIFQFFLEASGPFFGTLKGADKFGPWEENLGSRQLASNACASLANASVVLMNYYKSYLQSEIDKTLQ